MAVTYLSPGDTVGIYGSGACYGANGTESVRIDAAARNVDISPAVEILHFVGNVSDFAFRGLGPHLAVYAADGGLVATVTPSSTPGAQSLRFGDGGMILSADPASGAILLGGVAVSSAAAAAFSGTPDPALKSAMPQPAPKPDPKPDPEPEPEPEPGGTFVVTGSEDQRITGTARDDTYDATKADSILAGVSVRDPSVADHDVMEITLTRTNLGGDAEIVNVEDIRVTWEGAIPGERNPTFDASGVSSTFGPSGGSVITVSNARDDLQDAWVAGAGSNTIRAGANVVRTLAVSGLEDGGRVETGGASRVELIAAEDDVTLRPERDLTLVWTPRPTGSRIATLKVDNDRDVTLAMPDFLPDKVDMEHVGSGALTLLMGNAASGGDFSKYRGADRIVITGLDCKVKTENGSATATYEVVAGEGQNFVLNAPTSIAFSAKSAANAALTLPAVISDILVLTTTSGGGTKGVRNLDISLSDIADIGALTGGGGGIRADSATTVRISGAGNLSLGVVDAATSDGAGPELDLRGHTGHLTVKAMHEGTIRVGRNGSDITAASGAADTPDDKVIIHGNAGEDHLTLGGNADIASSLNMAGSIEFLGGGGSDSLTFSLGMRFQEGSSLKASMGAGADTALFESHIIPASMNGASIRVDLGGDPGDTLKVADRMILLFADKSAAEFDTTIDGIDIIDLGKDSELFGRASRFTGSTLSLKGDGALWLRADTHSMDFTGFNTLNGNNSILHILTQGGESIRMGSAPEIVYFSNPSVGGAITLESFQTDSDKLILMPGRPGFHKTVMETGGVKYESQLALFGSLTFEENPDKTTKLLHVDLSKSGTPITTPTQAFDYAVQQLFKDDSKAGWTSAKDWTDAGSLKYVSHKVRDPLGRVDDVNDRSSQEDANDKDGSDGRILTDCKAAAAWFTYLGDTYIVATTGDDLKNDEHFGGRTANNGIGTDYVVRLLGTHYTGDGLAASLASYESNGDYAPVFLDSVTVP